MAAQEPTQVRTNEIGDYGVSRKVLEFGGHMKGSIRQRYKGTWQLRYDILDADLRRRSKNNG